MKVAWHVVPGNCQTNGPVPEGRRESLLCECLYRRACPLTCLTALKKSGAMHTFWNIRSHRSLRDGFFNLRFQALRAWPPSLSPFGTTNESEACPHFRLHFTFEDSPPDIASWLAWRSLSEYKRRGEVERTTTSTRTISRITLSCAAGVFVTELRSPHRDLPSPPPCPACRRPISATAGRH